MPKDTPELSNYQKAGLEILRTDPTHVTQKLTIKDKKAKFVRLEFNTEQWEIHEAFKSRVSLIILKGRQIGCSTGIAGELFVMAFTSEDPITIVIITHKMAASKELLKMHKTFYSKLPEAIQELNPVVVNNETEFEFQSGARFVAMAAGSEGGIRAFTANVCHLSEFSRMKKPDEVLDAAVAAVNDGILIYETTAKFYGDAMHQEIIKYEKHEHNHNKWKFIFFDWRDHAEYTCDPSGYQFSQEERDIQEELQLTDGQLAWRKDKIAALNSLAKFHKEYPTSVEEAYELTGDSFFHKNDLDSLLIKVLPLGRWTRISDFDPGDAYVISADPSGGHGGDPAAITITSKKTGNPALVYGDKFTTPTELADLIIVLSKKWGDAVVIVESNNHGGTVLAIFEERGFYNLWKDENGKDWYTTTQSKQIIFNNLKHNLKTSKITVLDHLTAIELKYVQIDEDENVIFPKSKVTHCDKAMTLALGQHALESVTLPEMNPLDIWAQEDRAQRRNPNRRY